MYNQTEYAALEHEHNLNYWERQFHTDDSDRDTVMMEHTSIAVSCTVNGTKYKLPCPTCNDIVR